MSILGEKLKLKLPVMALAARFCHLSEIDEFLTPPDASQQVWQINSGTNLALGLEAAYFLS